MQPHDMAEQGLLEMPISSLITRVSGRCSFSSSDTATTRTTSSTNGTASRSGIISGML